MGAAPSPPSTNRRYLFGEFTLDLERGALLRAGAHVDLRPKAFEVLRLLVERHGRLVTKQDLLDAVWGRVVVTEGSVAKCLIEIRRAIGDGAQKSIKTVPRRGYIFDEPVTVVNGQSPAPILAEPLAAARPRAGLMPRQWISGAALAITVIIAASWVVVTLRGALQSASETQLLHAPSVAVLPFVDMSAERENEYLADGIAEEILNLVAQVPAVTVIARSSSFAFKGQNADIATIAKTLNVTYVLEGSLRKSGNQVRITARFVDATTSAELWTATYDRELDDLFAVQSEIAGAVAGALRGTLDGSDQLAASDGRVHEQYLLGRFLFNRRQPGDLESALAAYRQALAIEPSFAKAWAGLAGVYFIQAAESDPGRLQALLPALRDAVDEALRLDPTLAEAHVRRSGYLWLTGDMRGYEEEMRLAAVFAPDDPLVLGMLAANAARAQNLDESISLQSRAVALDPLSLVGHSNLGCYLYYAGRFEAAEAEWRAALDLAGASAPASNEMTRDLAVGLAQIEVAQQRSDSALALVDSWLGAGKERDYSLALIYGALGRTSDADVALARLREAGSRDEWESLKVIEAHAFLGHVDAAFEWLAKAVDQSRNAYPRTPATMAWKTELRHSPFVTALREDPRWQAWLAEG
ncbi:MAG TPA: winged helix-turn-helix domain-containing protein [Gammaproteobacteria bacterium]|nr:winged helix-turn-helix domain-containing protein [Gammaproteobacteria bacterium]